MNRRAFLQLFGMAAAAYAVQPLDALKEIAYEPVSALGPSAPITTLSDMTRRVAKAFRGRAQWEMWSAEVDTALRLGDHAYIYEPVSRTFGPPADREPKTPAKRFAGRPPIMTDQITVSPEPLHLSPGEHFNVADLDVCGEMLATEANKRDLAVFGALDLPRGIDGACNVRVPAGPIVRGVQFWDTREERMILRFDILGGRAA